MPFLLVNDALQDEINSINAIYDPDTLDSLRPDSSLCALRLPSLPSITLRVEFPSNYPDAPPSILGTQTVGDDIQKGVGSQIVDIARDVLATVYQPGAPCIFELLEETREALEKVQEDGTLHLHDHLQQKNENASNQSSVAGGHIQPECAATLDLGPTPPWTIAPAITEKKSVFIARCAPVSSPAQARSYLAHFLATDKRAAKATHNITAWRIRGPNDTSYQDCDDDGETAAGGRVLHLMQMMDVWDVMVVVTRWYGGILLGADRFKIINSAAREALVLGGWKGNEEGKKEKKKK